MSKSRFRPDPDPEFHQNWVPIPIYVGTVSVYQGKIQYFTGTVPIPKILIPKMPKRGYRFRYRKNLVRYFRDRYGMGSVFDTKCSSLP
ncbi:hypothetical protein Hanom_Chr17g01589561 [Helianthus anomalus]